MEINTAGIIGGAIGQIGGGLLTNSSAKREAQRNRNFQEYMSSTAHQRQVADLRAAGLNPILSANSGASSPSGAQANIQNAGEGLIASALDAKRMKQELKAIDSNIGLQTLQGHAATADAMLKIQSAKQSMVQTEALAAGLPAIKAHGKYDEKAAPLDAFMKRLLQGTSAVGNLRGLPVPQQTPKKFEPIGIGGPR